VPPNDFVSRGQALIASGQFQEAVKVCRLGLLGRPTEVNGRLVLAQALMALRRYDEVLAEMRVTLELESGLAAAHSMRGEALLRKGDPQAARESLLRARSMAPGDPSIAALLAEADVAIASGGARLPSIGDVDPATKHYPSKRDGRREAASPSSSSFTRPSLSSRRPAVAAPLVAAERTGTVEIDPEMSGVEIVDDDDSLDEVIDPPVPDRTGDLAPEDLTEIDEATDARARSLPEFLDSLRDDTVAGRNGRAPQLRTATGGPDLRAMFPDDDSSVESTARRPSGASVGAGGAPMPLRAPAPTHETPLARRAGGAGALRKSGVTPASAPASESDDMRTIRAGLGLDPELRLPSRGPVRDDSTGMLIGDAAPAPRRRDDESSQLDERFRDSAREDHTRKVATDPGGNRVRRLPRGPRLRIALWTALAVIVIGGGVYGGFEIRAMRLDRQVAEARRDAESATRDDTWLGWRAARDVLEGIVRAQDNGSNRAALARARAVLAADYGDDPDGARAEVERLGKASGADAAAARAYLALLDGDVVRADAAVQALTAAGASPEAEYLAGRAALLAERWDDAATAFDRARAGASRPAYLIGLARAHAGRHAWPEARAAIDLARSQHPDHPAVEIERARIVAGARSLPDGDAAIATIEKVLAEGARPAEEQTLGVSPSQAAWAALALAELQVMRGDPAAARRALERARAAAPAEAGFAAGTIDVLLAIGDVAAARQAADAAQSAFASAAAVQIGAAEVALAEGDPARALDALGKAGDLSTRPEALALRGQAHLAAGQADAAMADLDAALAKAPDLERALVARAELDLAAGNPRVAATRLERRFALGGSPELAITYAAALRGVGERDRARAVLAPLLAAPAAGAGDAAPGTAAGRAWLETARLERDSGDARAARAAYTKAIERLPDATGARLESALLLADTGDARGARESLDRLVADLAKRAPGAGVEHGRVLVEAARVHVLTGDLDGARALLDRAETVPSAARWLIARERGRIALRQRTFPVAIEALERAAGLEPGDGDTRLLLIDAHLGADDGASARRVLEDVQKRFYGKPESLLAVGRVRLYFQAFGEARDAFLKAKDQLEQQRGLPRRIADATYWLAATTYFGGDGVKARPLALEALRSDPYLADAYVLLGWIDADRKQWRPAIKWWQKVTALDPENVEAWFNLGEAALNARQPKVARAALQTYLEKAPSGDLAGEARAMLKQL